MALQYISHADETERRARILRVQQSIEEDKNKTPTVLAKISHEVNKEKGHVFSYDMPHSEGFPLVGKPSRHAVSARSGDHTRASQAGSSSGESNNSHSVLMGPTVFSAGALGSTSTGILRNKKKSRQRPPAWVRHVRPNKNVMHKDQVVSDKLEGDSGPSKRKAEETELSQAGIEEAIARGWEGDRSQTASSVMDRLSKCRRELSHWKKQLLSNDHPPHTTTASPNAPHDVWEKPPADIVKCNVGMAWEAPDHISGSSWIVRDCQGKSLHHSRQALLGSSSKTESDLRSLLWAVQAMGGLRHKKVFFEASSVEVRESLLNPYRCPTLLSLILKILELLYCFEKWTIFHVSDPKNKVAKTIAESVISGSRFSVVLLIKHAFDVVYGANEYPFTIFTVFALKAIGILLPMLVIIRTVAAIQSSLQHQFLESEEDALSSEEENDGLEEEEQQHHLA
ncbi:hypothetical protein HID58_079009 [Brassica napus]|uniref:RNase H type-1 domain-containing protein n=1 Tax=Brassica napus TaxID=3708 RepID=A0ABQ7Y0S8_BRANA|nr:hypothetical protein HID58_079009 [Brassica napus]